MSYAPSLSPRHAAGRNGSGGGGGVNQASLLSSGSMHDFVNAINSHGTLDPPATLVDLTAETLPDLCTLAYDPSYDLAHERAYEGAPSHLSPPRQPHTGLNQPVQAYSTIKSPDHSAHSRHDKLYADAQRRALKATKLQKAAEAKDLLECTFKPTINSRSRKKVSQYSPLQV